MQAKNIIAKIRAALLALLLWLLSPVKAYAETVAVCWANHKGSEGVVKVGTSVVAEVRGFDFDESVTLLNDTVLSDTSETHQAGTKAWAGNISCWWDETDTTGQGALVAGAEVVLNLGPEGLSSGDIYYAGTAIVQSIRRGNAINSIVSAEFSFTGSGPLAVSTGT